MDRSIEMFMNVEKALIQAKCLSMPVILIHPDVDKIVQNRIKDIIKRHQGTLTGIFTNLVDYFTLYKLLFFQFF